MYLSHNTLRPSSLMQDWSKTTLPLQSKSGCAPFSGVALHPLWQANVLSQIKAKNGKLLNLCLTMPSKKRLSCLQRIG